MIRSVIIMGTILFLSHWANAGIYLYIPEIKGESTDDKHTEWIDLLSIRSSVWNEGILYSGGLGELVTQFGDLEVTKQLDGSSPRLILACAQGKVLPDLVIEVTREVDKESLKYFELRLREALISSFTIHPVIQGEEIQESISINYNHLEWLYWELRADGTAGKQAEVYWDLETSTGGGTSSGGGDTGGGGTTNYTPTIQPISNQTMQPGEIRTVDVLVSDANDPADSLVVTASTNNPDLIKNLTVSGSGSNRVLSFTASSLYSGLAGITVRVSDGKAARSLSFTALIDTEATPFEAFMAAYFDAEEQADNLISSPLADPDGDDMATLMEYALGTNPREYTLPQEAIEVNRENTPEGPVIRLNFLRRTDDPNLSMTPWMAPESLLFESLAGNPDYEETAISGDSPLFDEIEGIIHLAPEAPDVHMIRMQVKME